MRLFIMRLLDFNKLLENTELREGKIEDYTKSQIIKKEEANSAEINGHIAKAEHNLSFIQVVLNTLRSSVFHSLIFDFVQG